MILKGNEKRLINKQDICCLMFTCVLFVTHWLLIAYVLPIFFLRITYFFTNIT